ncbi:MAG: hypothetical protein QOF16_805 [Actinomycetota bacterium]|jgi:hypothetical protein|nr:hypothetical protein [Actinomycetota bacterium]
MKKYSLQTLALVVLLLAPTVAHAWTTQVTFEQQSPDPQAGGTVQVGGHIEGTSNCTQGRKMRIQRSEVGAYVWRTITATRSDANGDYTKTVVAHTTKDYRIVAVAAPHCGKQEGGNITIHVK